MLQKIYAVLRDATAQARAELQSAGCDMPSPSEEYFAAVIHQSMFCTLCKADPRTLSGGDARIAIAIIRNSQNIAKHKWGADLDSGSEM
jgi:hypothetical protein